MKNLKNKLVLFSKLLKVKNNVVQKYNIQKLLYFTSFIKILSEDYLDNNFIRIKKS